MGKARLNRGQRVFFVSGPILPKEGSDFGGQKVDGENVRGGWRQPWYCNQPVTADFDYPFEISICLHYSTTLF